MTGQGTYDELPSLLRLVNNFSLEDSDENLEALSSYVRSGEFRDEEFIPEMYAAVFALLESTLVPPPDGYTDAASERIHVVRQSCLQVLSCDEFEGAIAGDSMPLDLYKRLVWRVSPARINSKDLDREGEFIQSILTLLYSKVVSLRWVMRQEIGKFLKEFTLIPTRTCHLTPILNVLNLILSGMHEANRQVFFDVLLPLHRPNGWVFWDRQTPILGEYHKPLVQCCYSVVEKDRSLATELVDYILSHCFAPVTQSNTAKDLLLLFELQKFIDLCDNLEKIKSKMFRCILDSIASENAQVVQSVLTFWKSPPMEFPHRIVPFLGEFMQPLLSMLFRGTGELHWNPTVNKMTLLVLEALETADPELFARSANACIGEIDCGGSGQDSGSGAVNFSKMAAPVLNSAQPPLGITGMAPWVSEQRVSTTSVSVEKQRVSGLPALRKYMEKLRSFGTSSQSDSSSSKPWQEALSAETPTLLPELKFHNLVFGKDLGTGAFSTVRYARVVRPQSYLSGWSEVAVKVVSFEILKKHNYGANITREICCLRTLSHPGVARLISSFKWRDGMYLVLEYGALGDLHAYLHAHGVLSEAMAKIVVGEVATALVTVHEAGFVYGDLKPENVVITSARHVKLADFGACRPVTDYAKNILADSRDALANMRSGDWKDASALTQEPLPILTDEDILNPTTFEGTPAYMAPELVIGGLQPSVLSDAWALGLLTYYVLKARLPPWVGVIGSGKSGSVSVDLEQLIAEDLRASFQGEVVDFLTVLLKVDPESRTSVGEVLKHPWLGDSENSVRALYKTAVADDHLPGATDGGPDMSAGWEKRQLSKIWTAQPTDYALGRAGSKQSGTAIEETEIERGRPFG